MNRVIRPLFVCLLSAPLLAGCPELTAVLKPVVTAPPPPPAAPAKAPEKVEQIPLAEAETKARTAGAGVVIAWTNSGGSGTISAIREGYDPSGNFCRDLQTSTTLNGKPQKSVGTVCRQPDGVWKVVK